MIHMSIYAGGPAPYQKPDPRARLSNTQLALLRRGVVFDGYCSWCGYELEGSPSDYFCKHECQVAWMQQQGHETAQVVRGYRRAGTWKLDTVSLIEQALNLFDDPDPMARLARVVDKVGSGVLFGDGRLSLAEVDPRLDAYITEHDVELADVRMWVNKSREAAS